MPKNKRAPRTSSGINKKLKAIRHAQYEQRDPYYARLGFPTRTEYRQFKRVERLQATDSA